MDEQTQALFHELCSLDPLVPENLARIRTLQQLLKPKLAANPPPPSSSPPEDPPSRKEPVKDLGLKVSIATDPPRPGPLKRTECPIDVLFVESSPLVVRKASGFSPVDRLDQGEERRAIVDAASQAGQGLVLKALPGTFDGLVSALRVTGRSATTAAKVLHITGHGGTFPADQSHPHGSGFLLLEGQSGEGEAVASEALKSMLSSTFDTASPCQLAVVASCSSEAVGKALLAAKVAPVVVAVRQHSRVADSVTIKFVRVFYESLAQGETILSSFQRACTRARVEREKHSFGGEQVQNPATPYATEPYVLMWLEEDCKERLLDDSELSQAADLFVEALMGGSGASLPMALDGTDSSVAVAGGGDVALLKRAPAEAHSRVFEPSSDWTDTAHRPQGVSIVRAHDSSSSISYSLDSSMPSSPTGGCFAMDITPLPTFRRLPRPPWSVVGRTLETFTTISTVRKARITVLRGPPGVGKSVIALGVAQWMVPRHQVSGNFRDGVVVVGLRNVRSYLTLHEVLWEAVRQAMAGRSTSGRRHHRPHRPASTPSETSKRDVSTPSGQALRGALVLPGVSPGIATGSTGVSMVLEFRPTEEEPRPPPAPTRTLRAESAPGALTPPREGAGLRGGLLAHDLEARSVQGSTVDSVAAFSSKHEGSGRASVVSLGTLGSVGNSVDVPPGIGRSATLPTTGPSSTIREIEQRERASERARALRKRLQRALAGRSVLLVLDDVDEPLVYLPKRFRALVHRLLEVCPDVRVLVTSRSPLGLGGSVTGPEKEIHIPPLDLVTSAELLVCSSPIGERLLSIVPESDARTELQKLRTDPGTFVAPQSLVRQARLRCLSRHAVVRQLCGHPQAICLAARRMRSLDQSLDELEVLTHPSGGTLTRSSRGGDGADVLSLWPHASLGALGFGASVETNDLAGPEDGIPPDIVSIASSLLHAKPLLTGGGGADTSSSLPVLLKEPRSPGSDEALGSAGRAALLSMELLVAAVTNDDRRALALLTLIGMFPGGLTHVDLDMIWGPHGPVFAVAPADAVSSLAARNASALRAEGIAMGGGGTAGHGLTDREELTATEGGDTDGESTPRPTEEGSKPSVVIHSMLVDDGPPTTPGHLEGVFEDSAHHGERMSLNSYIPAAASHSVTDLGASGFAESAASASVSALSMDEDAPPRRLARRHDRALSLVSLPTSVTSQATAAAWAVQGSSVQAAIAGGAKGRRDWLERLRSLLDVSAAQRHTVGDSSTFGRALVALSSWVVVSGRYDSGLNAMVKEAEDGTDPEFAQNLAKKRLRERSRTIRLHGASGRYSIRSHHAEPLDAREGDLDAPPAPPTQLSRVKLFVTTFPLFGSALASILQQVESMEEESQLDSADVQESETDEEEDTLVMGSLGRNRSAGESDATTMDLEGQPDMPAPLLQRESSPPVLGEGSPLSPSRGRPQRRHTISIAASLPMKKQASKQFAVVTQATPMRGPGHTPLSARHSDSKKAASAKTRPKAKALAKTSSEAPSPTTDSQGAASVPGFQRSAASVSAAPSSLAMTIHPPPVLSRSWLFATKANVVELEKVMPFLSDDQVSELAISLGQGGTGPSHSQLWPTWALLSLGYRASPNQVADCYRAVQLTPASLPSGFPATRALRLEFLLRACVHFHVCAEFCLSCLALGTEQSRQHAKSVLLTCGKNVHSVLDMAPTLVHVCAKAEAQRPENSDPPSSPVRPSALLPAAFVSCCREGIHHAGLAAANFSLAALELGFGAKSALELATKGSLLCGVDPTKGRLGPQYAPYRSITSIRKIKDTLRLPFALGCVRKAVGICYAAMGEFSVARWQLLGAKSAFAQSQCSVGAEASALTALGMLLADGNDLRGASKFLDEAFSMFRFGKSSASASLSESDGMPGAASAVAFELGILHGQNPVVVPDGSKRFVDCRRLQGEVRNLQGRLARGIGTTTMSASIATSNLSQLQEPVDTRAPVPTPGEPPRPAPPGAMLHELPSGDSTASRESMPASPPVSVTGLPHCDAARWIANWIPPHMEPAGNISLATSRARKHKVEPPRLPGDALPAAFRKNKPQVVVEDLFASYPVSELSSEPMSDKVEGATKQALTLDLPVPRRQAANIAPSRLDRQLRRQEYSEKLRTNVKSRSVIGKE
jgi:hypothetical protein